MAGDFMGTVLCSFLGASVFIAGCVFVLVAVFPIVQITVGVVNVYECPAAPLIPVYVIVCGILALLVMAAFAVPKFLCPVAPENKIWTVWVLSLVLFIICLVYGSYQVYSVYPPNYNKNITDPDTVDNGVYTPENQNQTWVINKNLTLRNLIQTLKLSNISNKTNREHLNAPHTRHVTAAVPYCDRTVYLFAFWTTTLVYALAASALVALICLCGIKKIFDYFDYTINHYLF